MKTEKISTVVDEQAVNSRSGGIAGRLYAGLLLAVLILLFFAGIWGTYFNGINGWVIVARLLFVLVMAASLVLRPPDWRAAGFRFDNMRAAWNFALLLSLAALLMVLVVAAVAGRPIVSLSPRSILMSLLSGLAQQAVILGYFFRLWEVSLQRSLPAALANSALFGVIHVPDLGLVLLAGLGGLILHLLFLRGRNVYVIGLAHGIFSILLIPALMSQNLMQTPKIGPSELLPFARRILRESGPGSRVAVCSRFIAGDVFRDSFDRPVARIFRGLKDDRARRRRLSDFLAADYRVYCVITERELRELMPGGSNERLYRLAEGRIWRKRRPEGDSIFGHSLLDLFLERVTLISNRPAAD